jgi:hypothetical protein
MAVRPYLPGIIASDVGEQVGGISGFGGLRIINPMHARIYFHMSIILVTR